MLQLFPGSRKPGAIGLELPDPRAKTPRAPSSETFFSWRASARKFLLR